MLHGWPSVCELGPATNHLSLRHWSRLCTTVAAPVVRPPALPKLLLLRGLADQCGCILRGGYTCPTWDGVVGIAARETSRRRDALMARACTSISLPLEARGELRLGHRVRRLPAAALWGRSPALEQFVGGVSRLGAMRPCATRRVWVSAAALQFVGATTVRLGASVEGRIDLPAGYMMIGRLHEAPRMRMARCGCGSR